MPADSIPAVEVRNASLVYQTADTPVKALSSIDLRITELKIDERLTAERAKRPGFFSLSFNTIVGFNGNGAMPHYRATPESHAVIEGNACS